MKNGFLTVAAAIPDMRLGDPMYNAAEMCKMSNDPRLSQVDAIVFPELSLTGYSCQDLFRSDTLHNETLEAVKYILRNQRFDRVTIFGMPLRYNGMLLNCAVVTMGNAILGFVPKRYLPNYHEFYEKRWFTSSDALGGKPHKINYLSPKIESVIYPDGTSFMAPNNVCFGVEVCEDLWAPVPPSTKAAMNGAQVIFNLSTSNELIGKNDYLRSLIMQQSARCICGYVYAGSGFGESSQDLVYGGKAFIAENGSMLSESERYKIDARVTVSQIDLDKINAERLQNTTFASSCAEYVGKGVTVNLQNGFREDEGKVDMLRHFNPLPFVPYDGKSDEVYEEILTMQSMALARRIRHIGIKDVVIGVSGGLDSTLALLVCARSFDMLGLDRSGIHAVTMPGFGTTGRTHDNATTLMFALGVDIREIPISESVKQHFKDIGHDESVHDVTYENCQARERTQILMDLSNELNGIVIGTGTMSELALGWATYNGDHMSMYGVNVGVPKTLVRHLIRYSADKADNETVKAVLRSIYDTPISPELLPADSHGEIEQKTEDLIGPYEVHDFFLYNFLRFGYSAEKLVMMATEAFNGEDKRVGKYTSVQIRQFLKTFFKRFFTQQFKRSCLPDGPKIGSVSLSPRGDWRMPSDASCDAWLKRL